MHYDDKNHSEIEKCMDFMIKTALKESVDVGKGAGVARHQMQRRHRHVEQVAVGVFDAQVLAGNAAHGHGFQSPVTADAVGFVHHRCPGPQLGEVADDAFRIPAGGGRELVGSERFQKRFPPPRRLGDEKHPAGKLFDKSFYRRQRRLGAGVHRQLERRPGGEFVLGLVRGLLEAPQAHAHERLERGVGL